jgi:hypothetical protein
MLRTVRHLLELHLGTAPHVTRVSRSVIVKFGKLGFLL